MSERQITISLPDHLFAALRLGAGDVAREMRLALAIRAYQQHRLSLGKAAELAGLERLDFMETLGGVGVTLFDYDEAEVDIELDGARALDT